MCLTKLKFEVSSQMGSDTYGNKLQRITKLTDEFQREHLHLSIDIYLIATRRAWRALVYHVLELP